MKVQDTCTIDARQASGCRNRTQSTMAVVELRGRSPRPEGQIALRCCVEWTVMYRGKDYVEIPSCMRIFCWPRISVVSFRAR